MEFHILYCRPCGYRDRAEELAVELRSRVGAEVVVEEGKFGQFDVLLEGELVASKGSLVASIHPWDSSGPVNYSFTNRD